MRVLLPLKTESVDGIHAAGRADAGHAAIGHLAIRKFGLEFLIAAGQVAWDSQPSPLTVEGVLSAERFGGELESVAEWLRALLSRGSLPAKQVFAQARECGISMGTLKRAKATIGVQVEQIGESDRWYWVWSLACAARLDAGAPEPARINEITCAPGQKPAELIEIDPAVR